MAKIKLDTHNIKQSTVKTWLIALVIFIILVMGLIQVSHISYENELKDQDEELAAENAEDERIYELDRDPTYQKLLKDKASEAKISRYVDKFDKKYWKDYDDNHGYR